MRQPLLSHSEVNIPKWRTSAPTATVSYVERPSRNRRSKVTWGYKITFIVTATCSKTPPGIQPIFSWRAVSCSLGFELAVYPSRDVGLNDLRQKTLERNTARQGKRDDEH